MPLLLGAGTEKQRYRGEKLFDPHDGYSQYDYPSLAF